MSRTLLDLFSLKGKVASITGASVGVGFAIAEGFAQCGADVAMWYNSHDCSDKARELAEKYGVKAKAYQVQITDPDAVEKAIAEQVHEFGKIDIFIANAGVAWTKGALIDEPDHKEWRRIMDVDVDSVYYCAKYIGRVFRDQGHGSLVINASISGYIVNVPQKQACYNAAKAALHQLSNSLAIEWIDFARVNTVSLGYIDTDMTHWQKSAVQEEWNRLTPMKRMANPKEVAGAFLYFASDASTYTTGSDLRVDGGYCAI